MAVTRNDPKYGKGEHHINSGEWVLYALPSVLMSDLLALFRAPSYRPPALPAVALELVALSKKPEVTYPQVLSILQKDPMLAARVLKVAQSPVYSGRGSIPTLQDALVRLGVRTLSDLFLEAAMSLRVFRSAAYEAPMAQLLRHSTAVAHAARIVCRRTSYPSDYAFLIGLMHDVGAAAAILLIADKSKPGTTPPPFHDVRDAIRDVHAEGSARLAQLWNLPPDVQLVLENHHDPRFMGAVHPMVATLCVAEHIVSPLRPGPHEDPTPPEILKASLGAIGLTEAQLAPLIVEITEIVSRLD